MVFSEFWPLLVKKETRKTKRARNSVLITQIGKAQKKFGGRCRRRRRSPCYRRRPVPEPQRWYRVARALACSPRLLARLLLCTPLPGEVGGFAARSRWNRPTLRPRPRRPRRRATNTRRGSGLGWGWRCRWRFSTCRASRRSTWWGWRECWSSTLQFGRVSACPLTSPSRSSSSRTLKGVALSSLSLTWRKMSSISSDFWLRILRIWQRNLGEICVKYPKARCLFVCIVSSSLW